MLMASSPALYRPQGSWAACKARLLVQREKFCRLERMASLSSSTRMRRVGQVRRGKLAHLGIQVGDQLPQLGRRGLDAPTGFWPVSIGPQRVTNSCMAGSVFSASWKSSRCSWSARRQGCSFCLRSCMACSLSSGKRRFSACTVKADARRQGLGESLPGFLHADEVALQPGIGLAGAARVVAQLDETIRGPRRGFLPCLAGPRVPVFASSAGPRLESVSISARISANFLREADLPGRDIFQPAAILAPERHVQNFGPQRRVVGKQERHVVPFLRFDGPSIEEFRGQELPRPALDRQALDLVLGKRLISAFVFEPSFPRRRVDVAADLLDLRPGETVQRHDAAVLQHGHPLPRRPIQPAGLLGPHRGSERQQAENRHKDLSFHRFSRTIRQSRRDSEVHPANSEGPSSGLLSGLSHRLRVPRRLRLGTTNRTK